MTDQLTGDEQNTSTARKVKNSASRPAPRGSWLWAVTAGAAALVLGLATLAAIWFLRRPLTVLFLGLTLASALAPVVAWLTRWLPRNIATILVYIILVLLLVGLGAAIMPVLVAQAEQLVDLAPEYAARAESWIVDNLGLTDGLPYEQLFSQLTGLASTLASLPVQISLSLIDAVLMVFISLYTLLLAPNAQETLLSLFPAERRDGARDLLKSIVHAMGGYFRGAIISGLIIGSLTYIALLIIGVEFAAALALISGVAEFIPILGPFISGAFIVLVSFLDSPTTALITLIFILVLQQIESNIIAPNVMHPQTCISPLATMVAIFAGGTLGGILGALVAIPFYAACRMIVVHVVLPAIRRQAGAEPEEKENTC